MTPQGLKRSTPPQPRPSVFTVLLGFSVSLKLKSLCTFLNTLLPTFSCCFTHFFSIDYNISMPSTFISVSTGIVQLSTLCIPWIYNDCVSCWEGWKTNMFIMHRRIWYSTKQYRACVAHSCFNGLTVHRTYVLYTKECGMGQFTSSLHIALFSMHCRRTCCTQQCWL